MVGRYGSQAHLNRFQLQVIMLQDMLVHGLGRPMIVVHETTMVMVLVNLMSLTEGCIMSMLNESKHHYGAPVLIDSCPVTLGPVHTYCTVSSLPLSY